MNASNGNIIDTANTELPSTNPLLNFLKEPSVVNNKAGFDKNNMVTIIKYNNTATIHCGITFIFTFLHL